jgi:uncharacterized membrane protein YedE/YeeE
MKKRPDRLPREVSLQFLVELEVAFLVLSLEQQAHGMNEFIRALQGGGFGAGLGGGCTSGHGVCGIARLSPRSLVATAIFMATGFATMFVMRHVLGG